MSKFFKDNKIKIMYLLIMYMNADEKTSVKTDVNFGSAYAICSLLQLCTCYIWNALVFSQSDVDYFFMSILMVYVTLQKLNDRHVL